MFERIGKLFRGNKPEEDHFFEPEDHAKFATPPPKHNIRSTLFKRKAEDTITIKFLVDISCYDTARQTLIRQIVKAGTYKFTKKILDADTKYQSNWYFFRNDTRGLSEKTLNYMIEQGQAKIVNPHRED